MGNKWDEFCCRFILIIIIIKELQYKFQQSTRISNCLVYFVITILTIFYEAFRMDTSIAAIMENSCIRPKYTAN